MVQTARAARSLAAIYLVFFLAACARLCRWSSGMNGALVIVLPSLHLRVIYSEFCMVIVVQCGSPVGIGVLPAVSRHAGLCSIGNGSTSARIALEGANLVRQSNPPRWAFCSLFGLHTRTKTRQPFVVSSKLPSIGALRRLLLQRNEKATFASRARHCRNSIHLLDTDPSIVNKSYSTSFMIPHFLHFELNVPTLVFRE